MLTSSAAPVEVVFSSRHSNEVLTTFLLAGLFKGITAMGLPTVAMGLLGALMPPVAAASLLIVPCFVTDVWQLLSGGHLLALLHRLWPMLLAIIAGTVASAPVLTSSRGGIGAALGTTLVLYALVSLLAWQPSVPAGWEPWLSPLVDLATGLVTGATGIFVLPGVPNLQALRLPKENLIQALGLSFTTSIIALGVAREGALALEVSAASLLAVLPALLGMGLGAQLRSHIAPVTFRRWFLVGLALLGTSYLVRALRCAQSEIRRLHPRHWHRLHRVSSRHQARPANGKRLWGLGRADASWNHQTQPELACQAGRHEHVFTTDAGACACP